LFGKSWEKNRFFSASLETAVPHVAESSFTIYRRRRYLSRRISALWRKFFSILSRLALNLRVCCEAVCHTPGFRSQIRPLQPAFSRALVPGSTGRV